MTPYIVIGFLICEVVFMFATERFMGVFFEKRRTSFLVMVLSYLFFLVVAVAGRLLFIDDYFSFHIILSRLLTLFIISLNYESSVPKRLFAIASNFVLFNLILNFLAFLTDLLPASFLVYVNDHYMGINIIGSLLSYFVAGLLRRFKNIRKNEIAAPLFWVLALFVPGALLSTFIFSTLALPFLTVSSVIFLIIGAIIIVFYMYDSLSRAYEDKLKSILDSQEKEYYLSQCRLMQESLEKMKSHSHNMKIHLATIQNYAAGHKKAAEYLNSLLGGMEESNVYSDTGNIAFDSIINFKLKNAKEDTIKPEIKVSVPSTLNIEVADIVTIIGSLLDHALDAVAKMEEKTIKLNINFSKGNLFIKMENTFDGRVKYKEGKAGEEKSIVTRKNCDEHSYGLKTIRKSVEKYNGYMDIAHTDNTFSVGILLYSDDCGPRKREVG